MGRLFHSGIASKVYTASSILYIKTVHSIYRGASILYIDHSIYRIDGVSKRVWVRGAVGRPRAGISDFFLRFGGVENDWILDGIMCHM